MGVAEILWHEGAERESTERARVNLHHGSLYVAGIKKRSVRFLLSPPVVNEGVLRLSFAEADWCEMHFEAAGDAETLEAEINKVHGKRSQGSPACVPGVGGTPRLEQPRVKQPRIGRQEDEFGAVSQRSHLPNTSTASPDVGSAREAKRRNIDRLSGTAPVTPEKTFKSSQVLPPRRAPQAPSTVLSLGGRRSAVPQTSANYRGYRSSLTFGLRNLGNTCYLNAVMQACCALRELVVDLRAMSSALPPCGDSDLYRCTVETLQQMSTASAATGPVSPTRLREQVALASPMFSGGEQQDAHEFLLEFVNQLHDELLAARGRWLQQAPEAPEDTCPLATQAHLDSEVQKRLVCVQCKHEREVAERFRDFSLDFGSPGADSCSLGSMLQAYFAEELLEAKCETCGAGAAHLEKQLTLAPRVLVLHLKRFTPNLEKQRYDKQHQSVEIPWRLDLSAVLAGSSTAVAATSTTAATAEGRSPLRLPARPLAAGTPAAAASSAAAAALAGGPALPAQGSSAPGSGLCYDLRAVVAHDGGSPHSGHYTCYARGEDGAWRLYDDSVVREVSAGQDLQRQLGRLAYIVFYVLHSSDNPDAKA